MNEVTQILERLTRGDAAAADELLPLVYDELRRLAQKKLAGESPGQTLQATALVHEAYLRVAGDPCDPAAFDHRGHFFAAAAEAMRRILVDNARRKKRLKRGGEHERVALAEESIVAPDVREDLVAIDEALQRLEQSDPAAAKLVQLRYFAGLPIPEVASLMGISPRTADRLWAYARAWLHREMEGEQ